MHCELNPPMVDRLQAQTRPFVPRNTENLLADICSPDLSLANIASKYSTTVNALCLWLERPDIAARMAEIRSTCAKRAGFVTAMNLPIFANAVATSLEQAVTESKFLGHLTLSVESNTLRVRYRENIRKTVGLLLTIARFERSRNRPTTPPRNPQPKPPRPQSPQSKSPHPSEPNTGRQNHARPNPVKPNQTKPRPKQDRRASSAPTPTPSSTPNSVRETSAPSRRTSRPTSPTITRPRPNQPSTMIQAPPLSRATAARESNSHAAPTKSRTSKSRPARDPPSTRQNIPHKGRDW